MALEPIIRPFVGQDVTPQRVFAPGGQSIPPVRLVISQVGGTKTFTFSGSETLTNYMAAVHTEKPTKSFDMSTGKVA